MLARASTALANLRRPACAAAGPSRLLHTTARRADDASNDGDADFPGHVAELHRRKKRIDEKRRQKSCCKFLVKAKRRWADTQGGDFVDHLIMTVRGGRGGAGTSSFLPSRRGLGAPSGGNGGPGGSVYLTTSPHLTSLASVPKRAIGGQGGNGAGAFRHGRRGDDVVITVPIGTVVREVRREGAHERLRADEAELDPLERRARRRDRAFVSHPTYATDERDWREAESLLRASGRWEAGARAPSFDAAPPVHLDVAAPLPERVLLAAGGQGGLGNPHFATPATRTPRLASRGAQPPTSTYVLELKLLADVGLVGLPNAGKSTLLRALTGRRAEVADYAFTTLNPQVGVVRVFDDGSWSGGASGAADAGSAAAHAAEPGAVGVVEDTEVERARDAAARERGEYVPLARAPRRRGAERARFTVSDNPGLLARAADNVGLGHSFLRSIERSLALAYVLDAAAPDPAADLAVLRGELEAYLPGLAARVRVVVLNKADRLGGAAAGGQAGEAGEEPAAFEDAGAAAPTGQHDGAAAAAALAAKTALVRAALDRLPEGGSVAVLPVSGKYGGGLRALVGALAGAVDDARARAGVAPPALGRAAREAGKVLAEAEGGGRNEMEGDEVVVRPRAEDDLIS